MAKPKYTTETAIQKAKEIHGDYYNYSKFVFKTTHDKSIFICPVHGDFEQEVSSHFKGYGCKKCGTIRGAYKIRLSEKEAIINMVKTHGKKYDYSDLNYAGTQTKITIGCEQHGKFLQEYKHHMVGSGCPKCANTPHFGRSDYIKKANGRTCTFYTLKCFNEEEEFYKIGITVNDVKTRYYGVSQMPYEYKVILEVKGSPGFIWDMELEEKRKLKEFNYQPKIEFAGSKSECFTQYKEGN